VKSGEGRPPGSGASGSPDRNAATNARPVSVRRKAPASGRGVPPKPALRYRDTPPGAPSAKKGRQAGRRGGDSGAVMEATAYGGLTSGNRSTGYALAATLPRTSVRLVYHTAPALSRYVGAPPFCAPSDVGSSPHARPWGRMNSPDRAAKPPRGRGACTPRVYASPRAGRRAPASRRGGSPHPDRGAAFFVGTRGQRKHPFPLRRGRRGKGQGQGEDAPYSTSRLSTRLTRLMTSAPTRAATKPST
jgi:hypothetical protein